MFFRRSNLFTGIQPTGKMHLGNYFGIVPHFVSSSSSSSIDNNPNMISIVDLHSLTTIGANVKCLEMTAALLACGIDHRKTSIFQQSQVLEHCNLMWLLLCKTSYSRLNHMIQWKEKITKCPSPHDMGLLTYPVLQAADILLYCPKRVPVGADQRQHLEMASDLGKKINIPPFESVILECRVRDLRNPFLKMSKSSSSQKSVIYLTDENEDIDEKIRFALTDSITKVFYSPSDRPEMKGLLELYSMIEGVEVGSLLFDSHSQFKMALSDSLKRMITPIRKEFYSLMKDPQRLLSILKEGRMVATEIANVNYQLILKSIGL